MNVNTNRSVAAPDLIVPPSPIRHAAPTSSPADDKRARDHAMFARLWRLKSDCGRNANKHDVAAVLITALLDEGVNTRRRIIAALVHMKFEAAHVVLVLKAGTPSRWTLNDNGTFSLTDAVLLKS